MITTPERGLRVVALDDQLVVLQVQSMMMESMGHTVAGFTTVEAALAAVREQNPDLVMTDFNLGAYAPINGSGFAELVRSFNRDVPIILASAEAESMTDKERLSHVEKGVDDFVAKPIGFNQLRPLFSKVVHPLIQLRSSK